MQHIMHNSMFLHIYVFFHNLFIHAFVVVVSFIQLRNNACYDKTILYNWIIILKSQESESEKDSMFASGLKRLTL